MAENKGIADDVAERPDVVVEEAPKRVIAAEEGIDELKKQLEAEKSLRAAAERKAQEAATQVYKANAEVEDTNLQLISNAIDTIKGQSHTLKGAYAQAMSAGDYTKAADIQLELSSVAVKLSQLENGKQAMEERPKTPPPVSDPVEALAAQLTPRSAAWVRAHPECANDPRMYRKMVRAHEDAIDDGMKADTDEYFDAVERRLGLSKREEAESDDDGTELAAKAVSRRSSPAAAPVSRSAPTSSGSSPRVIRLTADEREMARLNKMSDQEYFEQKQKISRDQRYN